MLFKDLPERKSARLLALSENLLIYNIYEEGFVTDGASRRAVGAPIYGDPSCAAIATMKPGARWVAPALKSCWRCRA